MRHFLSRLPPPPPDRVMLNGSVDADFVLALPFHHGDLEPDCVGVSTRGGVGVGAEGKMRSGEMLPTLALGWRASALPSAFAVDNLTVDSQVF